MLVDVFLRDMLPLGQVGKLPRKGVFCLSDFRFQDTGFSRYQAWLADIELQCSMLMESQWWFGSKSRVRLDAE